MRTIVTKICSLFANFQNDSGTWRDGFKAGYAQALTFENWNDLRDWADAGQHSVALGRFAKSTDLSGGRHTYIDTYAAGMKDARISISEEMKFIGRFNSGDTERFFKLTQGWIRMQEPDKIVPPGHF
jgi:hypothetical protein